jgi:glycosyltransferase involved in cell wall biosynthesis
MTILLSALTRYHVFDLAQQLQQHAQLAALVTSYPRMKLGRYADLAPRVVSRVRFALARKAALKLEQLAGARVSSPVHELVYSRWSSTVARVARESNATAVYGLSGYMREVLESGAERGRPTIVDHGSLHIETERQILQEECARFGFSAFGNWQYEWLVRRMRDEFAQARHIVCCSELARETMVRNGVAADKLVVHKLGVNLDEFSRKPGRPRVSGPMRLMFVGAMTPLKGLHYLLDAFMRLDTDTELWLVGALPSDPVLKKMLADCMQRTGRVKVIGPVAQAELNALYHQCDLFVLPSLSDGWGMVVSQALACGLPVVVSDMTGAKELVTPGENGYIIKSGNVPDLIDKLAEALVNCRHGIWQEGVSATGSRISGQTWNDYGSEWAQWLQRIAA